MEMGRAAPLHLPQRPPWAGLWVLCAIFFLLMALGPVLHFGNITWQDIPVDATELSGATPFTLLNNVIPFMRISRSVSRYALMVQLAVALLAGLGLNGLLLRATPGRQPLLFAAALIVILGEYWVAPFPISPPDTPAFYADAARASEGAILNLPMNFDRPGYLLYQTVHGRPLTVAYISRDDPRTLTERAPFLQHLRHLGPDIIAQDPAVVGMTVLNDLGVTTVVLDRYKMPGGLEREYTEALAAAVFGGRNPQFEDARLTVYTVDRDAPITPYLLLGARNWGPLRLDGLRMSRTLTGAATLIARHVDEGPARVRIRYRSLEGAKLFVQGAGDRVELPAAPESTEAILELTRAAPASEESGMWLELAPTAGGAVEIESLTPLW